MWNSRALVILAIAISLVLSVGCSSGGISSTHTWEPEDVKGHPGQFTTGSLIVKLECCEKESTMLGDMWFLSLVAENNTEMSMNDFRVIVRFSGKGGFVIPELETGDDLSDTDGLDIPSGQKARIKLHLYDADSQHFIDPTDIESGKTKVSVLYDY
jgi:hypothetical protein